MLGVDDHFALSRLQLLPFPARQCSELTTAVLNWRLHQPAADARASGPYGPWRS